MVDDRLIEAGYVRLANEIVRYAAMDLKKLIDKPPKTKDQKELENYEYKKRKLTKFFGSKWYWTLTSLDPAIILNNINDVKVREYC